MASSDASPSIGDLHGKDFDRFLSSVNSFGKYHKLVLAFVFLPAVLPGSFHGFNQVFLAAKPQNFWCRLQNTSSMPEVVLTGAIANLSTATTEDQKHCTMPDTAANAPSLWSNGSQMLRPEGTNSSSVPCQYGWEYDRAFYNNSIVTEWNLVCEKSYYPTIALIVLLMGATCGTPLFGLIGDRWGRKRAYVICMCIAQTAGIATAFSPDFIIFCVCRFFVGATYPSAWSLPFTLSMEMISAKQRATFGTAASIAYCLGSLVVVAIAYLVQDWRQFALATSIPLCYVFLSWYFMPESARWLLSRHRVDEVEAFFSKVAKCNKTEFNTDLLKGILRDNTSRDISEKENYSYWDLFQTPNMRKKSLLLCAVNCANLTVYLGLSYYSPSLGSNPWISYTLAALMEVPAYVLVYLTADRVGRRLPTVVFLLVGGFVLLGTCIVPTSNSTTLLVLGLIGKLCISTSFTFGEIYEQELFPTVVRSQGSAFTQYVSNACACVFPVIMYLGENYVAYPVIIFGILSVAAGCSALFLPETLDTDLPQTLEDGEKFGENMPWRDVFRFLPRRPRDTASETVMETRPKGTIVRTNL
ncbi:hypothetical protein RvY_05380 [Ramazzottius varieornatus]|uniref:Major facilitator superfamily (MFS) profile domain-containing protein n=1 Tax=Ramazzottius varieornatus TaxID=947166 RepID=A0A1D1UVG0_RAMVA|nr:hypothetical protein RvY_05380 [Ramazzottius varieornatus]